MLSVGRVWSGKGEGCAAALGRAKADLAAALLDDLFHQGRPQPAAFAPGARGAGLQQAEDTPGIVVSNSGAVVGDGKGVARAVALAADVAEGVRKRACKKCASFTIDCRAAGIFLTKSFVESSKLCTGFDSQDTGNQIFTEL